MLLVAVLPTLLLAIQQPAPAGLPPSPVKRIEVQPATRTITAGDSVRLVLRALDANGAAIPNAVVYVKLLGGEGEGTLRTESGWLVASSVGKFPLALSAVVPGTRPFVDTTSTGFEGVPGPAVRLELSPAAATPAERPPRPRPSPSPGPGRAAVRPPRRNRRGTGRRLPRGRATASWFPPV